MADDNKWKKIIFIVVIILVILMLLIFFFIGFSGLAQFFKILLIGLMILGIIFLLLYVFYLLFIKKSFKDIPATYRKKLKNTAKLMRSEMLGTLFLSGDDKHNRIELGKYRYLRINLPRQENVIKTDKEGNEIIDPLTKKEITKDITHDVPVDVFIVQKTKITDKFFNDPIFIICKPEDHDFSAIFNDVTLKGFNLVPLDSQFHTLNHRSLDIDLTKGIATNYTREVIYEIFAELDKMVKQAINLDSRFEKEKQRQTEFEIPQLGAFGQGGQR